MKLYEIDSQYMEYLYKADSKVLIHNSGNHQRKFIAIKVLINGYKYFVPLSPPWDMRTGRKTPFGQSLRASFMLMAEWTP